MYKCIPTKIQKCNNLFFSTFSINILLNSLYLIFASDGNPKLITVKIMWKYDLIKILKYLFLGVNLAFVLYKQNFSKSNTLRNCSHCI